MRFLYFLGAADEQIAKEAAKVFAKQAIIAEEARTTELSGRSPVDLLERFQRLRDYGLLPSGRGNNLKLIHSRYPRSCYRQLYSVQKRRRW